MCSCAFLLLAISGFFGLALGHDDSIYTVQFTSENFSEELLQKNNFVMFYAPWCGHCQRLSPIWEQLAEMLNDKDGNVRIAKVDCTTDKQVCSDQDVTGYPTLKFFKKGKHEGEKFRGTRDLPTLTTFINEQLREEDEESVLRSESIYAPLDLTDENFQDQVQQGKHFIKFYAPWCGHCQQLAPIWHDLAKMYEFDSSITIAKVDCTKYKSICTDYEIKAYPTLLWIEDGERIGKFQGSRVLETLSNYVKEMVNGGEAARKMTQKDKKEDVPTPVDDQGANELSADAFKSTIQNGVTLIKYFAPWCGHCKSLAPTWENLGKKYKDVHNIKIVKVDCTAQENKFLCNEEKVDGFPTIYLYKNGVKISEYTGSRSLEDLSDFVEGHVQHDEL